MALLPVADALRRILEGAEAGSAEEVDLIAASGRVLAEPIAAKFSQPPFDASAMDGYAVRGADVAELPAKLKVIGEAAAGHPFSGSIASGEAVRIFTGAPVPPGADAIVIQENTQRSGDSVTVRDGTPDPEHIRKHGSDFLAEQALLPAGLRLAARHVALAAAMGHGRLKVARKPVVAVLATGDELVEPGKTPAPGQIVASNGYGIAAMVEAAGAEARLLGIAADTMDSLEAKFAEAADADILITIGGASVGDHDLVGRAIDEAGGSMDFWKIAMRPGKPLMFARREAQRIIGLPGNPVSSLICTRVFVVPLVKKLLGLDEAQETAQTAQLTHALGKNGPRQHYMRATLSFGADGSRQVTAAPTQDSSFLSLLTASNCLIVRAPDAEELPTGGTVSVLPIDF